MKKICALFAAIALLQFALGASAEMKTFTFGGSGADVLSEIAAGTDGRFYLTGYTDSIDGTLARRTSQGRTGWLMCVDALGRELWSFCSRNGHRDRMTLPVVHADGTVSVVLRGDEEDAWVNEVLLFSEDGTLLSRKRIQDGRGVICVTTDDCYVFCGFSDDHRVYLAADWEIDHEGYAVPLLYSRDGTPMGELPAWEGVIELSKGEISIRQFEGLQSLYRRNRDGTEKELADIDGTQREPGGLYPKKYSDVIENADGSIVSCGYGFDWVNKDEGEAENFGLLSLFDSEGRLVSEMRFPAGRMVGLERIPGGYAGLVQVEAEYNDGMEAYESKYTLVKLDAQGIVMSSMLLGTSNADDCDCPIAALEDGTLAALRVTGKTGKQDTHLIIVTP